MTGGGGVDTGGGSLTLNGTSTTLNPNFSGVWVDPSSSGLFTQGGSVSIVGRATGSSNSSIQLQQLLSAGTGAIKLEGDRSILLGFNTGGTVSLLGGSGSSGGGGTSDIEILTNELISLNKVRLVNNNGTGIPLNSDRDGTGGGAIVLTDATLNSNGGNIQLFGGSSGLSDTSFAQGTLANPDGVSITNSDLDAGTGQIAIVGKGFDNPLATDATGIEVVNSSLTTTGSGTIALTGVGGTATGNINFKGIYLRGGTVISSENGGVSLTGTGGSGSGNNNEGILVGDSLGAATVQSTKGKITLQGTGQASGTSSEGVELTSNSLLSTGSPDGILITGTGSVGSNGVFVNGATIASTGGGDVILEANQLQFNSDNTFTGNGTGDLILKPIVLSDSFVVRLIGVDSSFQTLAPANFTRILIGDGSLTGELSLAGTLLFSDPLEIVGNTVDSTNAALIGEDDGSVNINATQDISTAGISTTGQAITLTSATGAIDTTLGSLSTTSPTGADSGAILLTASQGTIATGILSTAANAANINGRAGDVTLSALGDINVLLIDAFAKSQVTRGSAIVGDGGNVNIQTSGEIQVGNIDTSSFAQTTSTNPSDNVGSGSAGTVTLNAGQGITVTLGISTNAGLNCINCTFVGLDDLSNGLGGDITVNSDSGTVQIGSLFSSAIRQGGDITVTSEGDIDIQGAITSSSNSNLQGASLTLADGGNVTLTAPGSITVTGAITAESRGSGSLDILTGSGGGVNLTAGNNLTVNNISTQTIATSSNDSAIVSTVDGGDITLSAVNDLTLNGDFIQSNSLTGNGGSIQLTAQTGSISGSEVTVNTSATGIDGTGGQITLTAGNRIEAGDLRSEADQQAGSIQATAQTDRIRLRGINTQSTQASAGTIALTAPVNLQLGSITVGGVTPGTTVTLTSNEIDFLPGSSASATENATLTLLPFTSTQTIRLGGSVDTGTTVLDLTVDDLAGLGNGFSDVTIGGTNSFATLTLEPGLTFRDSVTLQGRSLLAGGSTLVTSVPGSTFTLTASNTGLITGGGITLEDNGELQFINVTNLNAGSGVDNLVINTGSNETIALTVSAVGAPTGTAAGVTFSGIDSLDAQGSSDTLLGTANPDTIGISAPNSGSISGVITFTGIENIDSGAGDDNLILLSTGRITGTLTGGTGTADRLDFSQQVGDLEVDLAQIGATGIEVLIGNASSTTSSTLRGTDQIGKTVNWTITNSIDGTVEGAGLNFGFSRFNVIVGGSADDVFTLAEGITLPIVLEGGDGTDTLDYRNFTTPITVDLSTGTATSLAGFSNLEAVTGGSSGNDRLTATPLAETFTLTAPGQGLLTNGTSNFSLSSIETIDLGLGIDQVITTEGDDTVELGALGSVTTLGTQLQQVELIDTAGGNDTLQGTLTPEIFRIEGDRVSTLGLTVRNLETLDANGGNDIFQFIDGLLSLSIDGGEGDDIFNYGEFIQPLTLNLVNIGGDRIEVITGSPFVDTLVGTDIDTTWSLTGVGTVSASGLQFQGFENLTGGSGNDTFTFTPGSTIAGILSGGAGFNILDYSNFDQAVTVNLGTNTATATGGIRNMQQAIGSASSTNTSTFNTLIGLNTGNTVTLSGLNTGSLDSGFNFTNFQNIGGGTGDDRVVFQPGASVTGQIAGDAGSLTLEGDQINFGSVSGTGLLQVQTQTANRAIRLGGDSGDESTVLELSAAELSGITGFSQITIGSFAYNGLITAIGDLSFSSPLTVQTLGSGGTIDFTNGTIATAGTPLSLLADQSITTADIQTNGGALTLTSTNGTLATGNLRTDRDGLGGILSLTAPGTVTTADLNSSGNTGGAIIVTSGTAITTGGITSRGLIGDGGDVTLDPPGDVEVSYIDATGGAEGLGGNISVTTESLFRATALIPDSTESISSAGGLGGGAITIYHNGVQANEFFTVAVGKSPVNGTLGGITSGQLQVRSGNYGQTLAVTPQGEFVEPTGVDDRPNINLIVTGVLEGNTPVEEEDNTTVEEEGGCPSDCQSEPPQNLPDLFTDNLFSSVTEEPLEQVDTELTDEVADYNGVDRPQPRSLPQVQGDLKAVEEATGIKPALIYAIFNPSTVTTADQVPQPALKVLGKAGQPNGATPEVFWEFSEDPSFDPLLTSETIAQAALPSVIKRQTLPTDELELVVVTANGTPIRVRVAGANRSRVEQAAGLLRQEISDPSRTGNNRYLQPSRLLYNWLIRPIETALEENGIQNLVFVMEAGLRSLPVAALNDGERFLIEKYSAGMMPSLALTDTRYRDIRTVDMLAMGASKFSDQNDLPTVPVELEALGNIWKGQSYLNEDFTIANLTRNSDNFGIIHLATHADFLPGNVSNSYIALSNERISMSQLREFGWQGSDPITDPPVELLTLSACKTAIGNAEAELGFAGLAVQAGVKTALASLWYVSDAATTGLMTQFYEILSDTEQAPFKAEALREAQLTFAQGKISVEGSVLRGIRGATRGSSESDLELPLNSIESLSDRELSHPYYWAAFTLVGSPW